MNPALAAVLLLGAVLGEPDASNVVRIPASQAKRVQLVQEQLSVDGSAATVVFRAPGGIFFCDVLPLRPPLKKLTFIIRNEKHWEGVQFFPGGDMQREAIDLSRADGVRIFRSGKDVRIEFGPAGMILLKQGGRFQFVNQYRG